MNCIKTSDLPVKKTFTRDFYEFKCPECDSAFKTYNGLNEHAQSHYYEIIVKIKTDKHGKFKYVSSISEQIRPMDVNN